MVCALPPCRAVLCGALTPGAQGVQRDLARVERAELHGRNPRRKARLVVLKVSAVLA
jgi:hypothetical protein